MELFDSKSLIKKFYNFFDEYKKKEIRKAIHEDKNYFPVDFFEISEFDISLGEQLLANPEDVIAIMEQTLKQFTDEDNKNNLKIRLITLPSTEKVLIRDIRSEHLGKLVLIQGLVVRKTDVRPRLTHIEYLCTNPDCNYSQDKLRVPQLEDKARLLKACPRCKAPVEQVNKVLVDSQSLVLGEIPEHLENSGDQPKRINILLQGDLVSPFKEGKTNPGARVYVIGMVKEIPKITRTGAESIDYDLVIQGNNIELSEEDYSDIKISKEEEDEIRKLSASEGVVETLVANFAPSIYGNNKIKEAIMLQLFGGAGGTKGDGIKVRGDIHILLIGDPGAAKSQLLKAASKIAPKSSFVSGKSASGVGLTAAVVRDEIMRGFALEAGALVLASGGLCAIDELDKMSDEDTSAMHEALEQQCYHYDFELQFADGSTNKIGKYVDDIFEKNKKSIIEGVNCEILNVKSKELLTTNFSKNSKIIPQRISRHKPFDNYYKITFSNGRSITVTPEHPLFVYKADKIKEISTALVKKEMLVPAPRNTKYLGSTQKLTSVKITHHNNKEIFFPKELNFYFAKLLGYHASEGHSYYNLKNRYAEIGISNTDLEFVEDCKFLFNKVFKVQTNTNIQKTDKREKATKDLYTIRCSSIPLYNFFKLNFEEFLNKAPNKRIPNILKKSKEKERIAFLQGYFSGDGFIDSNRCGFSTSSYFMACDLQDLLLSLEIYSYIATEKRLDKRYYKVVISGHNNIDLFLRNIVKDDKRNIKIENLLIKSKNKLNDRDLIPYDFLVQFNDFLKKLKCSDGYFTNNIKRKQNAHREVVIKYFEKAKLKLKTCKDISIKNHAKEIEKFLKSDIRFLKINDIEIIKNDKKNKWVYDVTVLPNNTFISQGLVLHNTISIAKANIRATLQCQTTVLGAANPKMGRFDPYGDIAKQINFPPALISRFDLIFILRDIPDKKRDDLIANHILQTHKDKTKSNTQLSPDFIKKYIAFARTNIKPILTNEAIEKIKDFYVRIRTASGEEEEGAKSVPITARQLEAIVRLAEAYAKIKLDKKVKEEYAQKAIDILMYCLEKIGIDPKTGELDIDRITTGITATSRNQYKVVSDIIDKLETEKPEINYEDIAEEASKLGVNKGEVQRILDKLKQEGIVFEPRKNVYKKLL